MARVVLRLCLRWRWEVVVADDAKIAVITTSGQTFADDNLTGSASAEETTSTVPLLTLELRRVNQNVGDLPDLGPSSYDCDPAFSS